MKFLKLFIIVPLAVLILSGCEPGGSSFKIKGTFRDLKTGQLFIYSMLDNAARFDTISLKDGEFVYKGTAEGPTPYILVFPNAVEQVIFVDAGKELEYEATANDLKNYVVNGSEENKIMNRFRKETFKMNAKDTETAARRYIEENATSPVAIYLFDRYFVQNEAYGSKELKPLLQVLKQKQPQSRYLLDMEGQLNIIDNGLMGKSVPDLTLKTQSGEDLKLYSFKTDYTLIFFWASWMPQSYEKLNTLRVKREKVEKKDKMTFVTFSLDSELYNFDDYVRYDTIDVTHCCDGKSWDSPVVKKLGVTTLPVYIVIDKNHKIVARGSTSDSLTEDIKKFTK